MPRRLRKVDVVEVSNVKRPANRRLHLIVKGAQKDATMEKDHQALKRQLQWADPKMGAAVAALVDSRLKKAEHDAQAAPAAAGDGAEQNAGYSPQTAATLRAVARMMDQIKDNVDVMDLVAIADRIGMPGAADLLGDTDPDGDGDDDTDAQGDDDADEQSAPADPTEPYDQGDATAKAADDGASAALPQERTEAADDEVAASPKNPEASNMGDQPPAIDNTDQGGHVANNPADVAKHEDVRKSHEALEAKYNELVQKHAAEKAELQSQIAEERHIRLLKSTRDELQTALPHLAVDHAELAVAIKSMRDTEATRSHGEKLMTVLKAADAQLAEAAKLGGSLFGTLGSTQAGGPSTAQQEYDNLVDAYLAKSEGNISRQTASAAVIKTAQGREAYLKIKQERGF